MIVRFDLRSTGQEIDAWRNPDVLPIPGDKVRLGGKQYTVLSRYLRTPTSMRVSVGAEAPDPHEETSE